MQHARRNVSALQPRWQLQDLPTICLLQDMVFCFSPEDVPLYADDRHLACFDDSSQEGLRSYWAFLYVV